MKRNIILSIFFLLGTLTMTNTAATAEIQQTASGLKYEDTVIGDGATASHGQKVIVNYSGFLSAAGSKGSKFDSSFDRNEPFTFTLGIGQVIRGWDEGVAGMKVGGKRTLIIPAELGYGARGVPGAIPGNAELIFDVELVGIK